MRQYRTPGLNIALARNKEVIWEEGFGYADLSTKAPMTSKTVTHSGSMGKTYTATAVMQLVGKGVIGVDDPITDHLKEFQVVNPLGEREITFRDLLGHRTGLSTSAAFVRLLGAETAHRASQRGLFGAATTSTPARSCPSGGAKVGERFIYSNFGIATLGHLVEVTNLDGLTFSDYVQKHIIDPLGMVSTQFPPVQDADDVRRDIFERCSTGYARFGRVHVPTPPIYFADFPAGTVVTTPGDHIRLLLAYMNGGGPILRPETVELMLTPQVEIEARPGVKAAMGLVWWLINLGQPDYCFSHSGAHMWGWTNSARAYPSQGFVMTVFTNQWNMAAGPQSPRHGEGDDIFDFVSRWIAADRAATDPDDRSWAWKTSYLMGLVIAEKTKGALGIPGPLTEDMIDAMVTGWRGDPDGDPLWDPAAFRAGVADLLAIDEMTPAGVQAFLASRDLKVGPEELNALWREIGGYGRFPGPGAA